MLGLIGSLLAALHTAAPLPACRGDWLWTISLAGSVLAILPVAGAVLFALIRKFTGNNYDAAPCAVFAVIGASFALLLPWLSFNGASRVFGDLAGGVPVSGIAASALNSRSCFVVNQRSYLGRGPTVYEAVLRSGSHGFVQVLYLVLLVGLPLLGLLFVWLQGRAATRRGPGWPRRLLWIPFLVFVAATAPFEANVVVQLWLGFVPASLIGVLIVLIVGPPSWSAIDRSHSRPQYQELPSPEIMPEPLPESDSPIRQLADTPGPLPFGNSALTLPAPRWNSPNGRFRRVRTLGKGGFGTVWLAVDTHLDRTVAVKFAHAPDADTEQRMLREARALAAVRHPNCVRIYDIVSENEGLGIVMEYIKGPSLTEAIRASGRLDDVAAARLWVTMAGALDAAHGMGVLHRDIKPSNVIVDATGAPHLIDFGIARSKGDMTLTSTGMMMGTPDFLAPETAAGTSASPASDAWQLAATVAYALTGRPPRGHRESAMAALMAAANAERLRELPGYSVHLPLLKAALDTDPTRRPNLSTVHAQLTAWLARTGYSADGPVATVVMSPAPHRM